MADNSIWDLEEFKPYKAAYEARRARYAANWRYYKAEYKGVEARFASAPGQYARSLIETAVKPLYAPFGRAVNIDVALIPGDWHLTDEAAPLVPAIDQLFELSDWETEGDIWVRYGVAMGEGGIRLVDDREGERLYLQPVSPATYLPIAGAFRQPTPRMAIFIDMQKDGEGKDVEFAEVIEAERIRTFRNGEPFASGPNRPAEYPNAQGFVPLFIARHDVGDGQGEPTFDDSIAPLDQVNRQATNMAKMIERHAEPQWAAIGADAGDLEKSGDSVWFFPEGSDIKAVLAAVDFPGLLSFIQDIKEEMKDGLPELAFAKLVGVERVAAATIELQMAEAVFKIRRLRKAYDQALRQALIHAGKVASEMQLPELAVLDDPALKFDKDRPVITIDALTRLQIDAAQQSNELTRQSIERDRMLMAATAGNEVPTDEGGNNGQ